LIRNSRLGLAVRVIGRTKLSPATAASILPRQARDVRVSAAFMTSPGGNGAALDLHRSRHCVQSGALVRGRNNGAIRRRRHAVRPLLGAVPLVLLFEVLIATFPNYFSVVLGVVFVLIVYALPMGDRPVAGEAATVAPRRSSDRHVHARGKSYTSGLAKRC
jgi:branched-chain amino acid transport system permease protein